MRDQALHDREMVVAWDGWAMPEILAGAVVGALLGLTVVAVPPGLNRIIPDVAGVAVGVVAGALLSWVWRPRRIRVRTERTLTEEERTVRHAA